jgi:AAA+ superfamily predicted ATPase
MTDDIALAHLSDLLELVVLSIGTRDIADVSERATLQHRIAELNASMQARSAVELPSSLLIDRLGLSETEQRIVFVLAAISLYPELRAALSLGNGDPTLHVLRQLVYGAAPSRTAFDELGPAGTLRRFSLIERSDGGGNEVHETRRTWVVSRRVLAWLHGDMSLAPELAAVARLDARTTSTDKLAVDAATLSDARAAFVAPQCVVLISGRPASGRSTLSCAVAREANRRVLEIDARALATDEHALGVQLRVIARECRLLACVPLLRVVVCLVDGAGHRLRAVGAHLVEAGGGKVLVTCRDARPQLPWQVPVVLVEMRAPRFEQRASQWLEELGQGTADDAAHLATQFPLAPGLVHRAAAVARARVAGGVMRPEDIYAGIRSALDDKLAAFAMRVSVTQTWNDLVLRDDQLESIAYLIARVRQRRTVFEQWGFASKVGKGLGTAALLSGPPGTGKTMVAALIAKDLGLELYQVDTAKVVSKWIGETEQRLAELFDAAEAGHAVLLFDEADSLFGKRTDVKSSNDRHANLETNYLLQRLERFTGVCLLTSNHESNIDPAFQRRLSLHLRFEMPDVTERAALWGALIPATAPTAGSLDVSTLARQFAMSGGYIRNAVVRAAFIAADEGSAIELRHLRRAAELEYEGMGKLALAA